MKFLNLLAALSLVLFIGCGGSGDQQTQESSDTQQTEMADDGVRTITMLGVDQMQFVVESDAEGITLGDSIGTDNLPKIVGITAQPGEEIRIRLTTQSDLPASAMAHNWVLLTMNADAQEFINAAIQAKANDYIPENMTDQVYAQTGLAAGGETTEVTFTAPEEPGEYEFVCTFPGHYSAGMKGILTVEEASSEEAM